MAPKRKAAASVSETNHLSENVVRTSAQTSQKDKKKKKGYEDAEGSHEPEPAKGKSTGKEASAGSRLYLNTPCTALELSKRSDSSGWATGGDIESICSETVRHFALVSAPADGRDIATQLHKIIDGVELPACESSTNAIVVLIDNPGSDIKNACLQALGIKHTISTDEMKYMKVEDLWNCATLVDKEWSSQTQFCYEKVEDSAEGDRGDKIKKATEIMATKLTNHFEFNFNRKIVCAPVIYGGRVVGERSLVGVLGMRVWT
jgi:hypothetical protein